MQKFLKCTDRLTTFKIYIVKKEEHSKMASLCVTCKQFWIYRTDIVFKNYETIENKNLCFTDFPEVVTWNQMV